METPKAALFNLRGKDGELFYLLKERLEREHGKLSNSQVIRVMMVGEAKRKKITFKYKPWE
jgi:hypothetical protein